MLRKGQEQKVTEGSSAIQATGDVTVNNNVGLTYSEARQVALDVFRSNFFELAGFAKEVAAQRAEEITEKILTRLQTEHPAGFEKANDPDFQYALFSVQREYARCGDEELGDLLVDLLVDRSKQNKREIKQIVLNESLNTAPKLTKDQLSALAVIFLFRSVRSLKVDSQQALGDFFDQCFLPYFIADLTKKPSWFQHLEFCGCGRISVGQRTLKSILGKVYQGLFCKGFEEKLISDLDISIGFDGRLFIPCINDPSKIQLNAISMEVLEQSFERLAIPLQDREKIKNLFIKDKMSESEIKDKAIEIRAYMSDLFDFWSDSGMSHFTLTSVGIAIGHANIRRLVGDEFSDLSIWIN